MTLALPARMVVLLGACAAIGAGCGGGGGGEVAGSKTATFQLREIQYGRLVDDGVKERLVSPLTTVRLDPVTGAMVPGSLLPIAAGVDVGEPQSLGIGTAYLPRVVPRNGTLQLDFSAPIDPATVIADEIDGSGALLSPGSVQVRRGDGTPVAVDVRVADGNSLWIVPMAQGAVGFPASPVDFGPTGEPRADATGFLKILLPRAGAAVLRSTRGALLGARADLLGDPLTPIGINPGNRVLDFIALNQLIPSNETFNGFLPDLSIPRIVREHRDERTLDVAGGDVASVASITFAAAAFSSAARQGAGEWAGAELILRPGAPDEETHAIAGNDLDTVSIVGTFASGPLDGDLVRLARTEVFEPDLTSPIEASRFDPDNPQNSSNASFANFVEAWEIDVAGNVVAGPFSLRETLPAYSELRVRFSEPMDSSSFLQWETFRVATNPDLGELNELLTDVTLDPSQTVATIRPVRVDQQAGTFELVGWGKGTKNLQLILTSVPRASFLRQRMGSLAFVSFLDLGIRGLSDLGGEPVGFPITLFDPANPAIRYAAPFTSAESAITQPAPPVQSWAVIVHRMRGRPVTGIDPATGLPGVGYRDQPNYYRPIPEVNLQTNGLLAGSPVVFITKIHDEFFPPEGQFSVLAVGVPAPLNSNVAAANQPHDGARFQTVWRDFDCSPNSLALAGTLLDLYRVSWSPAGGFVTTDNYEDVSIHCAHSPVRPISTNNTAGADQPRSGMSRPFDLATFIDMVDGGTSPCPQANCNLDDVPNYWDTLVTCVPPGTSYTVTKSNLFTPPGDGRTWHPWPVFSVPFQYNNGDLPQAEKDLRASINSSFTCGNGAEWDEYRTGGFGNLGGDSLLFEVRIRPQAARISGQNSFSFVIGCLIDIGGEPNWRAYSQGAPGMPLNPDAITTDVNARCAVGSLTSTQPKAGDNSRYLGLFDYVKTTSKITSPYVRVVPSSTVDPDWFPAIVAPPLADQPAGTSVLLEFEGAANVKGQSGSGFSTSIDVADKKQNLAFRATLVGNRDSKLLPNFETIAIPYLRPFGQ